MRAVSMFSSNDTIKYAILVLHPNIQLILVIDNIHEYLLLVMIMIIINRMTSVRIQTTSTNYSEHYYEIPKFKESIMRSTIRPTFTSFCSNISKEHMFCFAKCDHKTIVQKNMTTKHSKYVPDHFFVRFVVRFFNKTEYIFGFFFVFFIFSVFLYVFWA